LAGAPTALAEGVERARCPDSRKCGKKCCPEGAKCKQGKCKCKSGREKCGKKCCPEGEVCTDGKCGPGCGSGETSCDDVCVDVDNDELNCGFCGNACDQTAACVNGECDAVCGDGFAESGEDCDGPDLNGFDCTSLGFTGGNLACDPGCHFDTTACF
jgi:hypothetical protein